MFLFGFALISLMTIGLFADPPMRRRAATTMRNLLPSRQPSTSDRGWAVVELLVVLLIASIVLATIILVIGGLATATPR
jgi:hypothetical protein